MIKVLLEAPILTRSGYGEHARLVFQSLALSDNLDIYINPLNWGTCTWESPNSFISQCIGKFRQYSQYCQNNNQKQEYMMQIHVGIPNEFEKKAPYSICVTAGIETDRISPNWTLKTNQGIDKIIVPSNHAKSGFINTGYEVINKTNGTKTNLTCACPVDVVPYPVKTFSNNEILDIDFQTDFNFLQISMLGTRKNIETSLKCFVDQFRENKNVGFILKTSLSKSSVIDRDRTKKHIEQFVHSLGEKKCKIYLIHGNLTDGELHSLYTHPKVKAYFTTTHGEGYGLPIFEAAYSGLPVIATDWSGHLDFLSALYENKEKKLFAKIQYTLKQVQKEALWDNIIVKDSRWAFPSEASVRNQLDKVYKNCGMYNKWAKALKKSLCESHEITKVTKMMNEAIMGEMKDSSEEVVVFE